MTKAVLYLRVPALTSAAAFLWAGVVLGGSLIAAPAKFQVADLSLPVALQVGRATFSWIALAELGFACILCITLAGATVLKKQQCPRALGILTALAISLFAAQWLVVMPLLSARTDAIVAGSAVGQSYSHFIYIGLELAKVLVLISIGFLSVRTNVIPSSLAVVASLAASMALSLMLGGSVTVETEKSTAPNLEPLAIEEARNDVRRLTPALLRVVYNAFSEGQENTIYEQLASVSHGKALEYLYLERASTIAKDGLEGADQSVNEIRLLDADVTKDQSSLVIRASLQVLGTVGHEEHLHVRSNSYCADLRVSSVEGAWKITEFKLLDVYHDAVGAKN